MGGGREGVFCKTHRFFFTRLRINFVLGWHYDFQKILGWLLLGYFKIEKILGCGILGCYNFKKNTRLGILGWTFFFLK